jgi:hypothetical protein
MLNLRFLTVLVFAFAMPLQVFAGPFGLEMGMKLAQLPGDPKSLDGGFYKLTKVPKPHSSFESYVVRIAPSTGVCWIKGIGVDITTNSYGMELKSAFEKLRGKLDSAYGKSNLSDLLLPNSIWNEPNDWMMGLIKKERLLAAQWGSKYGSKLPSDIESITLVAFPSGRSKGYLSLEYSGVKEDACDAELAAKEDDAL